MLSKRTIFRIFCDMTTISSQIDCLPWVISTLYPEVSPKEGCDQQNQQKSANPAAPGQFLPPEISSTQLPSDPQATICSTKSASPSSFYHQAAAPNQLPVSTTKQQHISFQFPTTRQQHQTSFQFLPPGSSTKPASSFYHQAAAPHQPASSKAFSQSAVNSTSLPHPHHGSQVCCCLDILWLFSSIIF